MRSYSLVPLVVSLLVVIAFGLTTILSTHQDLLSNQITFFLAGVILLVITSRIPSKALQELSLPLYILTILVLIFTLILGNATRGSVRWIDLGIFKLQPSEIGKPIFIAFFANNLIKPIRKPTSWLLRNALIMIFPTFLIFVQPDLGSALVVGSTWVGMLFASRFPKKVLYIYFAAFILLLPVGYHFLQDYQKARIDTFINPFSDPTGKGYNVIQAMIAVGSGTILGKGVRQGTQSHLRFLPERHTDFVFASFAEEFGFVGVAILLGAFLTFLLWLSRVAEKQDDYGRLLVTGVFWLFFVQTTINIGMNMGVLPVTGITLPFVSYGGSSILSSAIAIGFVVSLLKTRKRD